MFIIRFEIKIEFKYNLKCNDKLLYSSPVTT